MTEPETTVTPLSDNFSTPFLMTIIEMVEAHREEIEAGMEQEATECP